MRVKADARKRTSLGTSRNETSARKKSCLLVGCHLPATPSGGYQLETENTRAARGPYPALIANARVVSRVAMAKPPRVASRRTRIGRGGSAVRIEGDAFLLHGSVFVCGCGSLGWTVLQVALYGDEEPALVVVPLMYIAVVSFAIAYERFVLHRSPFKVLVHAHLVAVSVLPALLEMESGGFERSGGVLGWAAVAPFTAMVVLQNKQTQVRYAALFIAVVVTTVGYEQAMRTTDQPCRALFRTHYHVVQVWTWQVHMYCVATLLGVTANGLILLRMLTEKSENAIHAHKTLACSIMPPPVAREVFEQQWHRLREGKRVAAKTGGARSYGAYSDTSDSKRLGGDTQRGSGTWARRLLTPVLRAVMGEGSHSSGWSGGARVSRSSSSVASFSPPRSREHSLRSSLSLGLGDGVVGSVSSLSGVSPTNALDANALRELRLSAHTGSRRVDRHSGVKARRHADVTVIFVDIVGFSDMCKHVKPIGVLRFLEHYFALVDTVGEEHGVTKIRTVGDGYLAVSGLMADMGVKQVRPWGFPKSQPCLQPLCECLSTLVIKRKKD